MDSGLTIKKRLMFFFYELYNFLRKRIQILIKRTVRPTSLLKRTMIMRNG